MENRANKAPLNTGGHLRGFAGPHGRARRHTLTGTADGKVFLHSDWRAAGSSGYQVGEDLFSPLPKSSDLNTAVLDMQMLSLKGLKIPCVMPTPLIAQSPWKAATATRLPSRDLLLRSRMCPALRITYTFPSVRYARVQQHRESSKPIPTSRIALHAGRSKNTFRYRRCARSTNARFRRIAAGASFSFKFSENRESRYFGGSSCRHACEEAATHLPSRREGLAHFWQGRLPGFGDRSEGWSQIHSRHVVSGPWSGR